MVGSLLIVHNPKHNQTKSTQTKRAQNKKNVKVLQSILYSLDKLFPFANNPSFSLSLSRARLAYTIL